MVYNRPNAFFETLAGSKIENNGVAAPDLQQIESVSQSLETSNYLTTSAPVSILRRCPVGINIYNLQYSCEMEQNENPEIPNACSFSENYETTECVNEMSVGNECCIETSVSYLGIPDDAIMKFLPNTDKEGRENNVNVIDQPNCNNNVTNGLKAFDMDTTLSEQGKHCHDCQCAVQEKIAIQSTDSETESIIDEYLSYLNNDEDMVEATSHDMNGKNENFPVSNDAEQDMMLNIVPEIPEQEGYNPYQVENHIPKATEAMENGVEKDVSNIHDNSDGSNSCSTDDKDNTLYQLSCTDGFGLSTEHAEDGFDQESNAGKDNKLMDAPVSPEDVSGMLNNQSKANISEENKGEFFSVGNENKSICETFNQCKEIKIGSHFSQESSKQNSEAKVATAVDDHRGSNSSQEDSHNVLEKWSEQSDVDSVGFSGPLPFSGVISYSGMLTQVPYSGNISYRSDSSTSTRSFAFPIMAHEWNSSPAKIGPPDTRYFPRRRRWQTYFSCCKRPSTLFD